MPMGSGMNNASSVYSAIQDRRTKCELMVEGIGGLAQTRTKGSVFFELKSFYSSFSLGIHALVISSITSITPAVHVDVTRWMHLIGLQLADPSFGTPGGIDVLVGSDVWGQIVAGDIISGKQDEPHAQRTHFGWVVFGPASTAASARPIRSLCAQVSEDESTLENLVRNFWRLEEVPADGVTNEDDECERLFSATHSRTRDGRYVVRIPFRSEVNKLGDSYRNALRQFHCLERRLAGNDDLRERYVNFMREYSALGHMEYVGQPGDHPSGYFIPHHAVTTKFRVVFNASARTSTGISLNEVQLVGPTIQDSLVNIILRFRRYIIALTADIEKMFRQILVASEHRQYQRILWRESPGNDIGVYNLATVTYGMACSPFNAVRALQQCALDNYGEVADCNQALAARDAILRSFYVDDFLTSCNSIHEAVLLATNVDKILSAGHFKLRKWRSNSLQAIRDLQGEMQPAAEHVIDRVTSSVLGLRWDPESDELFFSVNLVEPAKSPTKRRVLSEVAQLFDPTGLLAPVVIKGKIFIQSLWSAGITWDAPLPPELSAEWLTFRNGLQALNNFRVPRWLGMIDGEVTTIHGFCDASSRAYAAVLYTRTTRPGESPHVSLLTARTKVAPLKGATIPRLELCAAHLLTMTLRNVRIALGQQNTPYCLWSDSNIVLCWLRKHPATLKPYVANRVGQIQEHTSPDRWHHIRSAQNPADCASRGMGADAFLGHRLWLHGPEWLMNEPLTSEYSNILSEEELSTVRNEERGSLSAVLATVVPQLETRMRDGKIIPLVERFSSLPRLLRTVARILRWTPTRRQLLRKSVIGPEELDNALEILIRLEQGKCFANDILKLRNASRLSSSSRLISLNPFLDDKDILRLGGRIKDAPVPHDYRFPIILPKTGALSWLLIQQTHETTLHGGTQIMLQTLRHRYWILHARQAVRTFLHNCTVCRRHRGAILAQQMASLPRQRVTAARPFIASGVDYCGPFFLRSGAKRSRLTIKTYMAIFICMVTKAVHIEVVDDLTSQAFIAAFTRFISRRGPCRDLYSDNGTAFVGANRILKEDLATWNSVANQQALANMGTNWHFITPRAPHQGGLWEAAVKAAKRHLVRLVGSQTLWYSQLQTLAVRIEACLNSRPLIPMHDDPDDILALTPGHFLIGSSIIALPEPNLTEVPRNRLKLWQWLQQVHQKFWQRWSDEYLHTLQTRSKWQRREEDVRVGDIVLVRHENLPPTHWQLGRVTEVHPGSDGLVRNVTLKTSRGNCARAVQKLCRLVEFFEPGSSTGQDV